MEQPELLAEDIRKFVTYLQNKTQLKGSLEKVMEN
jgi:hypothetical protein